MKFRVRGICQSCIDISTTVRGRRMESQRLLNANGQNLLPMKSKMADGTHIGNEDSLAFLLGAGFRRAVVVGVRGMFDFAKNGRLRKCTS